MVKIGSHVKVALIIVACLSSVVPSFCNTGFWFGLSFSCNYVLESATCGYPTVYAISKQFVWKGLVISVQSGCPDLTLVFSCWGLCGYHCSQVIKSFVVFAYSRYWHLCWFGAQQNIFNMTFLQLPLAFLRLMRNPKHFAVFHQHSCCFVCPLLVDAKESLSYAGHLFVAFWHATHT